MLENSAMCGHPGLLVLAVFLGVLMSSASTEHVIVSPDRPVVGQDVILNVTGITENIVFSVWYKGSDTSTENRIIRRNSDGTLINGPQVFPEAKIQPNGSLVIENVTKERIGNYTYSIQGSINSFQKTVYLNVYDEEPLTSKLSDGAIAGIVIIVIVVCGTIILVIIIVWKKKSKSKDSGPI